MAPYENKRISDNIRTLELIHVRGMDDMYLGVAFRYSGRPAWNGCIPLKSKYHGLNVPDNEEDVFAWVSTCYETLNPSHYDSWKASQNEYWVSKNSSATRAVFDALCGQGRMPTWQCRGCGPVKEANPQPAARIKSLKEQGYYIATKQDRCNSCGTSSFHDLLLCLPRESARINVRSTISVRLSNRIKSILPLKDACFDEPMQKGNLIIDHKFPSTRWTRGETPNDDNMPESEIRAKFQLLSNRTNLQKERYCKRCLTTGIRGDFFGIKWYSDGDEHWQGYNNADEEGCKGCPWYDLEDWKEKFNLVLNSL